MRSRGKCPYPPHTHTHLFEAVSFRGAPLPLSHSAACGPFRFWEHSQFSMLVEYICSQINFYGALDYDLTVSWNLVIQEVLLGWI